MSQTSRTKKVADGHRQNSRQAKFINNLPFDSGWNYRIVLEMIDNSKHFSIREVHYKYGTISKWSAGARYVSQRSRGDLCIEFEMMSLAFKYPVLILKDDKLIEDGRHIQHSLGVSFSIA